MKLDTKLLTEESIMEITDAWKQDWDKGIQVPNQKFMTKPNVVLNKNFNGNDDLEGLIIILISFDFSVLVIFKKIEFVAP